MKNPPHPGSILRDDVIPGLKVSRATAAKRLQLTPAALAAILEERAPITPEVAQQLQAWLGRHRGGAAESWLAMQTLYDQVQQGATPPAPPAPPQPLQLKTRRAEPWKTFSSQDALLADEDVLRYGREQPKFDHYATIDCDDSPAVRLLIAFFRDPRCIAIMGQLKGFSKLTLPHYPPDPTVRYADGRVETISYELAQSVQDDKITLRDGTVVEWLLQA